MNEEIREYLREIGRRGGLKPSSNKKYETNAERQKAYRERKKGGRPKKETKSCVVVKKQL